MRSNQPMSLPELHDPDTLTREKVDSAGVGRGTRRFMIGIGR